MHNKLELWTDNLRNVNQKISVYVLFGFIFGKSLIFYSFRFFDIFQPNIISVVLFGHFSSKRRIKK
jgi:hypothetical protein